MLLTTEQLAAHLGVSARQVQRLADAGMPRVPVGARAVAVGRPVAISGLARLLLRMHQQRPALHLVMPPRNDE